MPGSRRRPGLCFILALALLTLLPAFAPSVHAAPCPAPGPGETDITGEGAIFASTTYPGFSASLAVDCDTATSWFSTGPEPNNRPTIYRWTGARDDKITTIYVKSNGDHPQYPTDFGFGSVIVRVRNNAGAVVFEQQVDLPGTPDPDVVLHPNVAGQVVELVYTGHESDDCGGFGELRVLAERTPPTPRVPPPPTPVPPTAIPAPGTVFTSDTFDVPDSDLCDLNAANNALGGDRKLFYLPIFPANGNDADHPVGAKIASGALENNGSDFGGFQFALSPPCSEPRGVIRGADMGQDLNIKSDLLVPTDTAGLITGAGPYVRSRAAASGDGIIGGDSAGFWVILSSDGEIQIKSLNPWTVLASGGKDASFDASVMHTLEIAIGGNQLQVSLDGRLQTFNQNNELVTAVILEPTAGTNNGAAGIAFGAEANRGQIGGQRADNVIVKAYQPLSGLPVQNNFARPAAPSATTIPAGAPTQAPSPSPLPAAVAPTATPGANATPTSVAAAVPPGAHPTTIASVSTPGDCDNDARVSEADALCALEISVGLRAFLSQMDMDLDGSVTSRDAVIILERAVGQ